MPITHQDFLQENETDNIDNIPTVEYNIDK